MAIITGTDDDDPFLFGTDGNDTVRGLGGDDTLTGGIGADILEGGFDGPIFGHGPGLGDHDKASYFFAAVGVHADLEDETGNTGEADGDTYFSIEDLEGSNHADILAGDNTANVIFGRDGNDILNGRGGGDHLDGGNDIDIATYADAPIGVRADLRNNGIDVFTVNTGEATGDTYFAVEGLIGSGFDDILHGTNNSSQGDTLSGGNGDDTLIGHAGDDDLNGGANDDRLQGGAGADHLRGGTGTDEAFYFSTSVRADLSNPDVNTGEDAAGDTYNSIENLTGSTANDTLAGDGNANTLSGRAGIDTLSGNDGDDILVGGADPDTLNGNNHNDTLEGGTGGDALNGGSGSDTASYVNAVGVGGLGVTASLSDASLNEGEAQDDAYNSIENLTGSSFDDIMTGTTGNNVISGGDGDDFLVGGLDNDTLLGGADDDVLGGVFFENGDDLLDGGAGDDTLRAHNGNDRLIGGLGTNALNGGDDNDTLFGGKGADTMNGGDGTDTVDYSNSASMGNGFGVFARLYDTSHNGGDAADDTYISIENLTGSTFDDELAGNAGVNVLSGGEGFDSLFGREDNDTLIGGSGGDFLDGGTGNDTLEGGHGNDVYRVDSTGDEITETSGTDRVESTVSWSLAVDSTNVENLTLLGSANINGSGSGASVANTILGNDGANTLSGFSGFDTISGGDGNDVINGGADTDLLKGEDDNDVFVIAAASEYTAAEVIDGGAGTDEIRFTATSGTLVLNLNASLALVETVRVSSTAGAAGTTGADLNASAVTYGLTLIGDNGATTLTGTNHGDTLNGLGGIDTISGGDGNDVINGGADTDILKGEDDNDIFLIGAASEYTATEVIDGGADTDEIRFTATSGTPVLNLNASLALVETVRVSSAGGIAGTTGADLNASAVTYGLTLIGDNGATTLTGTNHGDTLDGLGGIDSLTGGTGDDRYFVDNPNDAVIELSGQGTDRVFAAVNYALAAGVSIEGLSTTEDTGTATINLTGNNFANTIEGNDGANVLNGGGRSDSMFGRRGNDQFYVDNAGDIVDEAAGEGTDRVWTSTNYTLTGGAEIETFTTTDNAGTAAINMTGNAVAQTIVGNDGNNEIDGKGGADFMYGRLGNDTFYVDNAGDGMSELAGQGTDRVVTSVNYVLTPNMEIETFTTSSNTGTGAINLTGNIVAQTIVGNDGDNVIDGKGGADFAYGRLGNDIFYVDNEGDGVSELAGQGNDRVITTVSYALTAGAEIETFTTTSNTGTGAIDMTGNALVNTIVANDGANVLSGAGGSDFLYGRGGADNFLFNTALGASNLDQIMDYNVAADTILLENAIFTALPAGTLAAAAFRTGAAAADADDRIIYNSASGFIYYDADGVGGGAATAFAKVGTGLGMTNADFLIM